MSSWAVVLDALEARLDEAEREGRAEPFSPPVVSEPLPPELQARAEALVTRGRALEASLTDRANDLRSELRRLPRMHQGPRGVTARFQADA